MEKISRLWNISPKHIVAASLFGGKYLLHHSSYCTLSKGNYLDDSVSGLNRAIWSLHEKFCCVLHAANGIHSLGSEFLPGHVSW